ncbi:MAG: dihydrodipicolinate reductase, partial [Alphaproteobacteria bacterium]
MALKVIQWGTGNVGTFALHCILGHPELELVGVCVHGAGKVGRDAGELCGLPPTGVKATNDVEAIL